MIATPSQLATWLIRWLRVPARPQIKICVIGSAQELVTHEPFFNVATGIIIIGVELPADNLCEAEATTKPPLVSIGQGVRTREIHETDV